VTVTPKPKRRALGYSGVTWGSGVGAARILETEGPEIYIEAVKGQWFAVQDVVKRAGSMEKRTCVRRDACPTRPEAVRLAQGWALPLQQRLEKWKAAEHAKLSTAKDIEAARRSVLQKEFPTSFAALSKCPENARAVNAALAVDLAEQSGRRGKLRSFSREQKRAVAAALRRHERHPHRAKNAVVDLELALGWNLAGYERMTARELAEAINARCGTKHTSASIKKRRLRLRLMSSQDSGPR
jgi:hypothetical protein